MQVYYYSLTKGLSTGTKVVTLNDLQWRNGRYFTGFGSFVANYVKVLEDSLILSATAM